MYLFSDESGHISAVPPRVSFLDHGFLFGDSIYEVVRLYDRKIFGEADHWQRLALSAERLQIPVQNFQQEIQNRIRALFRSFGEANACLRLIVTRGEGPLHIDSRPCSNPRIFMAVWKYEAKMRPASIDVLIPSIQRNSRFSTDPAIKSGNYLNSVLAFREAVDQGFDDALMLNSEGCVTEFTTSNVGWICGDTVFTPSTNCGILHGVTRKHFMKAISVQEGEFNLEDLMKADEAFALSTLKELVPIRRLKTFKGQQREWNSFTRCEELHDKLKRSINAELETQEQIF